MLELIEKQRLAYRKEKIFHLKLTRNNLSASGFVDQNKSSVGVFFYIVVVFIVNVTITSIYICDLSLDVIFTWFRFQTYN